MKWQVSVAVLESNKPTRIYTKDFDFPFVPQVDLTLFGLNPRPEGWDESMHIVQWIAYDVPGNFWYVSLEQDDFGKDGDLIESDYASWEE